MGEPALQQPAGANGILQYLYYGRGNTLTYVEIVGGTVVGVVVKPAPFDDPVAGTAYAGKPPVALGITLNDPAAKVDALPSARYLRTVSNDEGTSRVYAGADGLQYAFATSGDPAKVHELRALLDPGKIHALPADDTALPVLHGGTSFADAIVIKAPSEDIGVGNENLYFMMRECDGGGQWQVVDTVTKRHNGVPYDLYSVTCSTTHRKATFYFNIASYYGKG